MDHPKIRTNAKGELLLNFGNYGEEVEVAAVSRDGSRILTVREVDVAHIWNVETGDLLTEIRVVSPLSGTKDTAPIGDEFRTFIESAALNLDGTYALLGLNDGTAVIYAVDESRAVSVLYSPKQPPGTGWGVIRAVDYSTEDLAVVGFPGRCVGVWSTDGAKRIAFLGPPSEKLVRPCFVRDTLVSSVDMSADGRYVFAGAVDMTARIIDVESGDVVFEAMEHAEDILALLDGPTDVGWATTGGSVWLRSQAGRAEKRLDTGEHWAEVVFDRQGNDLLARSVDGQVTRWGLNGERKLLSESTAKGPGLWADNAQTLHLDGPLFHFPENGRRLAFGDGRRQETIERKAQIVRVKLSPKADTIAVDGWSNDVELWDFRTGEFMRSLPCDGGSGCFAFSADGSLAAVGEIGHGGGLYPRHVYVYETATGRCRHKLSEHDWQIEAVEFSADGRFLASLGDELVVWDIENVNRPILRTRLDRTTGGFAFVGGELLAVERGWARVFSGATERLAFEAPIEFRTLWTVSREGQRLYVAGNQSVSCFRLDTGDLDEQIAADIPRPARLPPRSLAMKHEIRGGAMLWRTEYGEFLHQSDGPRGWVERIKLSQRHVAVPCSSGAAILHVTDDGAELLGIVPFEGTLRAGHIVDGVSLLINEQGQLFRTRFLS